MTEFAELVVVMRDVILIVAFLLFTCLLLATFFLFRKVSRLVDSAKRTVESAEQVADAISSKLSGPTGTGSGIVFGLGKALAFFGGLWRDKKGKGEQENGKQ
jgi:hypothetical protein